jgi:hypothetical protein
MGVTTSRASSERVSRGSSPASPAPYPEAVTFEGLTQKDAAEMRRDTVGDEVADPPRAREDQRHVRGIL